MADAIHAVRIGNDVEASSDDSDVILNSNQAIFEPINQHKFMTAKQYLCALFVALFIIFLKWMVPHYHSLMCNPFNIHRNNAHQYNSTS